MVTGTPVLYDRPMKSRNVTSRLLLRRLPDAWGERGQSSVEYMGMFLAAAALVGVIIGVAPELGGQIIDAVQKQIDTILGQ